MHLHLFISWLYKEATVQDVQVNADEGSAVVKVIIGTAAYGRFKKLFKGWVGEKAIFPVWTVRTSVKPEMTLVHAESKLHHKHLKRRLYAFRISKY